MYVCYAYLTMRNLPEFSVPVCSHARLNCRGNQESIEILNELDEIVKVFFKSLPASRMGKMTPQGCVHTHFRMPVSSSKPSFFF